MLIFRLLLLLVDFVIRTEGIGIFTCKLLDEVCSDSTGVYTLVCTAAGICTVATVQPAGEEWEG